LEEGAFTLLELMIVVVILGIVVGILIFNFQGITQEAKESVVKSDLRAIKSALIIYENHFNSLPPVDSWEECLKRDRPRIIDRVPQDPFHPQGKKYTYKLNTDSPTGRTYVVLSVGKNGEVDTEVYYDRVVSSGDDYFVTNARKIEE